MIKWISKINWGKLILAGVIYTVVATVIHEAEAFLDMKYYVDPAFFGLWSKIMMPSAGPPPASFFITSAIITFATGVMLALVYYYIYDLLPANFRKRVFFFTDLMIGANLIFFTMPAYLMFNIPLALLVSWFVSTFVILLIAAFTFVKILK